MNKILIIDDEELVRESIAVYLEDSGYSVIEAEDGEQGLELFYLHRPDLVICDLRMPRMDGLEVLKQLSENSSQTPILIVSGAGQIHDVVEALRLGALDYLVKPVSDLAVLENAIVNALTRKQLEKENKLYRQELDASNRELEKNLKLLRQDQEAGRMAQLQLLPEPDVSINGFNFQHTIIPSLKLSGDFIDYFQISERYIGFYIADVSGHGSAAAFASMTLKSLVNQPLRSFRRGEESDITDPAKFMRHLNHELISANLNKHITLFYGLFDCLEQSLNYSVAGQYPAPVKVSRSEQRLIDEDGLPLGLFDWAKYENHKISIDDDFQLVMVSDGWLKLFDNNKQSANELALLDYIKKQKTLTIDYLLEPMKQYSGRNVPDDVSVFIVTKE